MYPGGGAGLCSPWGTLHSSALVKGHNSPLDTRPFWVASVTSEGVQNDMVKKGKEIGDDEGARGITGDENEEWKVRLLFASLSPSDFSLSLVIAEEAFPRLPQEGSLRRLP